MHLLGNLVRNAREAQAIVQLDVNAIRQQCIYDHLLACCAHERELKQLHFDLCTAGDPKLNAAAALVDVARTATRANVQELMDLADQSLKEVASVRSTLDWFRAANQSLVDELKTEGYAPLAAAKERLWLIEESLVYRIDGVLDELRSLATAADTAAACTVTPNACVSGGCGT